MVRAAYDLILAHVYRRRGEAVEILILRRAAGTRLGGTWHCIFGGVQAGEAASVAALREIREETALVPVRVHQLDGVCSFYVAAEDTVYHCPCFAAEASGDARVELTDEHDACEWVDPEMALSRLTWPGQRAALRELFSEILAPGPAEAHLRIPLESEVPK
jgi:dATP pyrophosphohydrolase